MPALLPSIAIPVAVVAAVSLAGTTEARAADAATLAAGMLDQATALLADAARRFVQWVETGYAQRPAFMIGLGGMLLLPPLLLAGALLYRHKPAGALMPEQSAEAAGPESAGAAARLEIEGAQAIALPQGRDLVQIGRHEDNDICIEDASVERYHAIIARSLDRGFTITDVSGPAGRGLRINGAPCASAVLIHGDMVELGRTKMTFHAFH
jgi:hypothetical protein